MGLVLVVPPTLYPFKQEGKEKDRPDSKSITFLDRLVAEAAH